MPAKPPVPTLDVAYAVRSSGDLLLYLTSLESYAKRLGKTVQQLKARVNEVEKRVTRRAS